MVEFILNGEKVVVKEGKKFLDFFREDMNIILVKNGCLEGVCGICMVIIDGKVIKVCVFKIDKLVGKNIIIIEGLLERERDVFVYFFVS